MALPVTSKTNNVDFNTGVKTNVDVSNVPLYTSTDITPNMTANNAPAPYVVSASSVNSTTYDAWKAFNGSSEDACWVTPNGTKIGWLSFNFGSQKIVGGYAITSRLNTGTLGQAPKNWTFEGSNNGTSWIVLDTQTNQTGWASAERRFYTFINTNEYSYYRINVSAQNGDAYGLAIGEFEMMEVTPEHLQLKLHQTGSSVDGVINYYSGTGSYETPVIDLGRGFKQITKINQVFALGVNPTDITPVMNSNTTPSPYVASASSIYSTAYDAWYAFDGSNPAEGGWITANSVLTGWLNLDFSIPKTVVKYAVTSRNSNTRGDLKNWTFEGSNDNSTWTVLDTRSNEPVWIKSERREYTVNNSMAYRYYRINVTSISIASSGNYVTIGELEMMETSTPVQVSTSTSTDGLTFSPYAPINADRTIASPQGKFIKIKVDFTAGANTTTSTKNDFVTTESTQFNADPNNQIIFDGSLKLKTVYQDTMTQDVSITDGKSFSVTIDKTKYKTIEKVMSVEDRMIM